MKHILTKTLLLLLAAAMALSLTACGNGLEAENAALKQELSALMEENALLKEQIEGLQLQLTALSREAGLADFGADYTAWADGAGASVTVTATPVLYTEGQAADLVVLLFGEEQEKMPFLWDGSRYTATVELPAADGYTFLCLLTEPDGSQQEIVLDSPEMDTLIYLESNLTAFVHIVVNDCFQEDGRLVLASGYAQVQLPRLSEGLSLADTALVLTLDGQEVERIALNFDQAADEDSFACLLDGLSFTQPDLEEDSQLDLLLEVTLSDGRKLSATGSSWYYADGELMMAVG